MLARSRRLPSRGEWAYEVKWNGFRTIVSTDRELWVRSRLGWNMTPYVEFLAKLPLRAVLDGDSSPSTSGHR
jgi:ATP-dependent DNA ligase